MKQSKRQASEFCDPVQQFQDLNRDNFASFGNLDSSQLEQLHLIQTQTIQEANQALEASQEFKSSDQFKNSTMQTAKYGGGVSVPTADIYGDLQSAQDQNCVSSSHSIGQHAAYMDYPLQYPVNIQTKQFNHSQSYPMAEMTEDTNRESVENIRSVRDNSSQGLKAGQKVQKNGQTYTVAGFKPTGTSKTVASKPRKNSKPATTRVPLRNISNNSRLSAKSRTSVTSKISVSKKSKKSSKIPLNQQRSVSQKSREHFKDQIKDIMKSNRNQNMNLHLSSRASNLISGGQTLNYEQLEEDFKMDSQRRTLEMRNQELTNNEALCSQAETLKAEREVQEMQEYLVEKQEVVCARNFINDAYDAVQSMEAVYQHPSKEQLDNQSQTQYYQQQSLNMTLNESEEQRMNFYHNNQGEEMSIPSTKPLSPINQNVSLNQVIYSQNESVPNSSKSPEPRNYSQILDQHKLEVSVVSPAMISERCQVQSNDQYVEVNQSRDSQTQFMARNNSQRIQTQNTQRKLESMMGSASANQTKACGVYRRNSCQFTKNARGRQAQKVMIDYPQARKKQRIKPQLKPQIPKHTRVETKYSMRRQSVHKNSSQGQSGSRSRSNNNSRIIVPSVTSPHPQDTSTMYRRDSTFFGSSVCRDNSRETKRDLNYTQSNMTISGIENHIYKDIQKAKEEKRADQIYTFQCSMQKPKGMIQQSFDNRPKFNNDLVNISSPGLGINGSSMYQSFENQKPQPTPTQDEDVKFVEFLKNVQIYLQQNETTSPKKQNGDHLYQNLQFLREKYKQFSTVSQQSQPDEFNYQKFREDFMETIKQCDMTNQATIKSDDNQQQNKMLLSVDVRSNDYPMLQTTLSQELGLKMMHSQSDVTMSARNYENKLKRMTEEALKPTKVRVKSPPGYESRKSKSKERAKTKIQNEQKKSQKNEETLDNMPERQKKQIEFIDSIYKKVILKTEKRQSEKQKEQSLQRKAKQVIDSINDKQQERKQNLKKSNTQRQKTNQQQMSTLQTLSSQNPDSRLSNYHQQNVRTPATFEQEECQSSQGRDQFSGFFHQPGTDHSSLQSKKNLNQPFQYEKWESAKYRQNQNNSSLNRDLQNFESMQKNHTNVNKFQDQFEVRKLQSHKYLKEIKGDLNDRKQKSLERSLERQKNLKETSFALQNLNNEDQRFADTYVSSTEMGTTQQTRGPFLQTHETAMLINQRSSTPTHNVSVEQSTQKGQGSCELLDQVKIMKQNIGDPSQMSVNQINQTLQALNKTAQELKRACTGITEYAGVLQQQQEQQINNIREEQYDQNTQNDQIQITQNQSMNYSQDEAFQAQCQQFGESHSGRCEAGTIDPYPNQIKTGYLTSYQETDLQYRDTFGQQDQPQYLYPQHKDSQTSYFFTDVSANISANQSVNSKMTNPYHHQNNQPNMVDHRRDFNNDSMDSMAFTNSQDIVTRQSDVKFLEQRQTSTQPSNMKQPPHIGRRFVNSSGQSSQYIQTDKNLSNIENSSSFQPDQDQLYHQQFIQKDMSEPRLVTDKDALDSAIERQTADYDIEEMQNRNSERFIDTIQNTQRQTSNMRPTHKTLEIDLEKTLQDQKTQSKAQMAASYKYSQQLSSRNLHSLECDLQTQKTSKQSGEAYMRYESQQNTIPVTDRTKFDFDNKSNTIRSYLYAKDSIENIENRSYQANQSEGSNIEALKSYDYVQKDKLLKTSTQKEYLSPVSEEFQQRHNMMLPRENTLTPEEFERAVLAQIKSDETQKGENFSSNFMDTKNIEKQDNFYYDPKGYQPVHTEFSQSSQQLKQKYIDQMSSGKNYNRTQEINCNNNLQSNRSGRDQIIMPQVGSSSLLGRNQAVKLSGNQISKHYETNQPNINTLDLNDSKQAYQDVKNGTTKVVGAEFMPTYLMNTMKTSEFSAGQTYGRSQIQDAFSFRDY